MVEVSIIMPVYNSEEYLKESIESVLNQSFEDFEFICIDDGSSDGSLEILQYYAERNSRMRVFHQENMGGGTARNRALEKAGGNYLLFIDSDDVLYSNALEETHEIIKEKKVDFLIFKAINYDSESCSYYEQDYFTMGRIYSMVKDRIFSYKDIGNLVFRMSATPWGKLYDMNFIKKSSAKFAEGIIFHDNVFFWDMLFSSEKIYFCNETLYMHRKHAKSIQGSKDRRFLNIFPAMEGIVSTFIRHANLERYKDCLYNWKVDLLYVRYMEIMDEYKGLFLNEFKRDLSAMVDFEGCRELMEILNENNVIIYENVMDCDTPSELNLSMEIVRLKKERNNLKRKKKELKEQLTEAKRKNENPKINVARLKSAIKSKSRKLF